MKIDFYIADPTGNITALVDYKPDIDLKTAAHKIMNDDNSIEQVGFISFDDEKIKLRMSGDEFCGNAAMSSAALWYKLSGKSGEQETEVLFYGVKEPVKTRVLEKSGYYYCKCAIKRPEEVKNIEFTADKKGYNFPLVCFDGITHIIADNTISEQAAIGVIKNLSCRLNAKALGIMLLNEDKTFLKPLVYVSGTDTLFFENSCASGSCAVSAAIGAKGEKMSLDQPGGTLEILNLGDVLLLSGKVKISARYSKEI